MCKSQMHIKKLLNGNPDSFGPTCDGLLTFLIFSRIFTSHTSKRLGKGDKEADDSIGPNLGVITVIYVSK